MHMRQQYFGAAAVKHCYLICIEEREECFEFTEIKPVFEINKHLI